MKHHSSLLILSLTVILLVFAASCSSPSEVGSTPPAESPLQPDPTETDPSTDFPTEQPLPTATGVAEEPQIPRFAPRSPVSTFTEEEINLLGVECQGSDEEIAACIKTWQEAEMIYCAADQEIADCTDPIRANYVLPGLYATSELVRDRQKGGQVYGICFDYAAIYCSIARYYGLECRVVNSISKPSEREGTYTVVTTGMSEEEYQRWKVEMQEEGLEYPYDAVRLIAEETPGHYWAEIKLGDAWRVMDSTRASVGGNTQSEYIDSGDFQITDWMANDKSQVAYEYAVRIAQGEDLRGEGYDSASEQFMEGREVSQAYGNAEDYEGVVDDLGQEGRSASVDDFFQGLGLMPYFNTCEQVCSFLGVGGDCLVDCPEEDEIKACYEDCAGEAYYTACMFLEEGEDVSAEAYEACSGVPFNAACEAQCAGED